MDLAYLLRQLHQLVSCRSKPAEKGTDRLELPLASLEGKEVMYELCAFVEENGQANIPTLKQKIRNIFKLEVFVRYILTSSQLNLGHLRWRN